MPGRVLIVARPSDETLRLLAASLAGELDVITTAELGDAELQPADVDVVIADIDHADLADVRRRLPDAEVVFIVDIASASASRGLQAMREGAFASLHAPIDVDEVSLVIRRAIEVRDLRRTVQSFESARASADARPGISGAELASMPYREMLDQTRDRITREYLAALLESVGGSVPRAAERAGIERESMHRLLKKHGVRPDDYKPKP